MNVGVVRSILIEYERSAHEYALALARALHDAGIAPDRCIEIVGASTDAGTTRYGRCRGTAEAAALLSSEERTRKPWAESTAVWLAKLSECPPQDIAEAIRLSTQDALAALGRVEAAKKAEDSVFFDAATRERTGPLRQVLEDKDRERNGS